MKSFVKFLVLVAISIPGIGTAEDVGKTLDALSLTQKSVFLEFSPPAKYNINLDLKKEFLNSIECTKNINGFPIQGPISTLASIGQLSSKIYTCDPKKFHFLRFSPEACTDAINCRKNVAQMNGNISEKLLNEIVAKDYAKNMLDQNIEVMDRLETLKRFAELKYNIKGEKCSARYQPSKNGGTCNLSLLDEVFVNQQENCHFGKRCFQKTSANTLGFKDYKAKNVIPNLAFVVDYNEYRIEQQVKTMKDQDEDFINGLASFVSSESFKAATAEQKADMFLKKLEDGDQYKDPILAFDFDSVSEKEKLKKTLKYRQLLKTFEGANLTQDSFKSAFESFRKGRAENILIDGSCSQTIDIKNICEEMTTLSKGEKLYKNSLSVEHLSSRNLSQEKDFEKFKTSMDENFTEMDYDILVNAKRCLSFGLANEDFSPGLGLKFGTDSNNKWYRSGNSTSGDSGPDENIVDNSRTSLSSSFVGEAPASKNEAVKMLEPREAEDESAVENSISSALANTQAATNNFASQFSQPFTPGAYGLDTDDKNEKAEKKEDSTAATNATVAAPADTKMTDLMKRLTSAEEKVDKMKAANEEAENNRIKQKKIDEENALIKDLKGQIADLKATKEKKEVEKEIAIANNPIIEQQKAQSNNSSSSFNSGLTSAPVRQEVAPKFADNYESGRSSAPAPSASSSNSRSISSAMLTSTTNNEGNKVLPSGIVLTTVDGMSSEKATQTISNKIIELNGTPFYIEEGGMVKEIIAVVKDGKVLLDEKGNPIYEKIVKGKVGDKKFAKVKDKNRAPAAITDAADLKRDQEEKMKRDRAEYLKLKNLTNGVIKNK